MKRFKGICNYRNCRKPILSSRYNKTYCNDRCGTYERREVAKENRQDRVYLGVLGKIKTEYINPNFSAKWLAAKWDKIKHEYGYKESR